MAVSTIKSSGGDYTSLSAWEAAKQADLTGNGPEEAECYDFQDTTNVIFNGWTTTASDYIRVYTPAAERHNGTSRQVSGVGYQLETGTGVNTCIINREDYFRLEGLNITCTHATVAICFRQETSAADVRIEDCILNESGLSSGYTGYLVTASLAGMDLTLRNCIIYGKSRAVDTRNSDSASVQYCTLFTDAASLGVVGDSELTTENTYSGGYSSEDFWTGGAAPSGNNNCSSDTTATTDYTSSLVSKAAADQFVNASIGTSADFHLKSGSDVEGQGANISGVTTDIDGDTRHATAPDIGADEFVLAGRIMSSMVAGGGLAGLGGIAGQGGGLAG